MEVCFIPGDYRDFLREQLPDLDREVAGGYFLDAAGRKLGQHKGFPFYTIGQRKGLENSFGEAHVRHPHKSDKKHQIRAGSNGRNCSPGIWLLPMLSKPYPAF